MKLSFVEEDLYMLLKEREVPRNQDEVSNHCYLDEAVAAWYAEWEGSEIPGCYVKCQASQAVH